MADLHDTHVDIPAAHRMLLFRPLVVAQVTPPAATTPPPAPPPADAPPADAPPATTPTPVPIPPPADNVPVTPNLTDEELARLADEQAQAPGEEIQVTGSAIQRKETTSAAPVAIIGRDQIEATGLVNLGEVLRQLPSQGNALNAQNNNGGDGSTRIDLRSLGEQRTLTLLNGRRMVAGGTGADDAVDFGAIPLAMIDRVEVLKDGASAIYGSDAISGVVNIVTKQDFNGTEASAYVGASPHGDGNTYDVSMVTGHSSKKGNITFSVGYQRQDPVLAGDRGTWASQFHTYNYGADPTSPLGPSLSGSSATPAGRITRGTLTIPGCDSTYCTADGHGGFRNYVDGSPTSFGDTYNFQTLNYLFTPSQKINVFAQGHYDVTDNTKAYFEAQFNDRRSDQQLAEEPLFGAAISADSLYNPLHQDVDVYNRRLTEFGPRTTAQDINTFRTVVGIGGKLGKLAGPLEDWKWDVNFDAGRTSSVQQSHGDLILSHLGNALGPSFNDPVNGPTCGTQAAPIPGCVPLSILVPGQVTQAMIDYLSFTGVQSGFNEQRTTTAQINGQVVKFGHGGDLSVAAGTDYRHEQGGFTPDPLTSTGDTTGNVSAPTEGSYHVFEGFAEASLVPVSGLDVAKWLEFDLAGRAYQYSNFGQGATWKSSALWKTVGGLTVRGTYGTAFRAPTIGELYAGHADSFINVGDPCDTDGNTPSKNAAAQCAAQKVPADAKFGTDQQRSTIGGDPTLKPEKAKVATAGVVWEPVAGLGVTVDYWDIRIHNALQSLGLPVIFNGCYESGNKATEDLFCGLIERDPANHQILHVTDLQRNLGGKSTNGIDVAVDYAYSTPYGKLRHNLAATYLLKYDLDTGAVNPITGTSVIHGKGNYDLGVNPSLKASLFTTWEHKSGVGAGLNARYVGGFKECDNDDCADPANGKRNVTAYVDADVFASYHVKSKAGVTTLTLGVNNVANVTPPVIYNGAVLNTDESAYDFMGRFGYLRLTQLF